MDHLPVLDQNNRMNQRVRVHQPGGVNVLKVVEEQEPVPQGNQVLVKVLAAGVTYGDVMLRAGIGRPASGYPVTPGYDVAGVVEALGPGASRFKVGDPVAGLPITGGYQRFICLAEDDLIPVPPGLEPAEVVSVILNYTTADQLMQRAQLKTGDRALFHGAAGGVGSAMLHLARLQGVTLYGTVSAGNQALVRDLGGVPIDYQNTDFVRALRTLEPGGVQAVFDPVGGRQLSRSAAVLARGGILVSFGVSAVTQATGHRTLALAETILTFLSLKLRPDGKRAELYLIEASRKKHPEQFRQDVGRLLGLLRDGQIKPQIARVLPLGEVRHAHELIEGHQVTGKIILDPWMTGPAGLQSPVRA